MTALKPIESRRVRSVAAERYTLNKKCAHPECNEDTRDPHHGFPASAIGGNSWYVEITFDVTEDEHGPVHHILLIPHVTGLCREHHDQVEDHRAWIKLEDGVWNWYDRKADKTPEDDHNRLNDEWWDLVGPLNPQPGSTEAKPKRRKYQGKKRRERKVISLRVPNDAEEQGAGLLDDAIAQLENRMRGEEDPRPPYYTIMDALNYTLLNEQEGTT